MSSENLKLKKKKANGRIHDYVSPFREHFNVY